jgi:hypothetical protein
MRQHNSLTVADLCRAIAEGRVPTRIQDGDYLVALPDLLRLQRSEAGHPMRGGGAPGRERPAS